MYVITYVWLNNLHIINTYLYVCFVTNNITYINTYCIIRSQSMFILWSMDIVNRSVLKLEFVYLTYYTRLKISILMIYIRQNDQGDNNFTTNTSKKRKKLNKLFEKFKNYSRTIRVSKCSLTHTHYYIFEQFKLQVWCIFFTIV